MCEDTSGCIKTISPLNGIRKKVSGYDGFFFDCPVDLKSCASKYLRFHNLLQQRHVYTAVLKFSRVVLHCPNKTFV